MSVLLFYFLDYNYKGEQCRRVCSRQFAHFQSTGRKAWHLLILVAQQGIQWDPTAPYSPERNGKAEYNASQSMALVFPNSMLGKDESHAL